MNFHFIYVRSVVRVWCVHLRYYCARQTFIEHLNMYVSLVSSEIFLQVFKSPRAWSEAGARPSTEQRVPKDIHRATAKPGIPRLLDESATTTF